MDLSPFSKRFLFLVPAIVVIVLDQISKHWCRAYLPLNVPRPVFDHWLYFTLTYNPRGAFSLFPIPNGLFIGIVAVLLLALLMYAIAKPHPIGSQILIGLILGGGIGNLIDRVTLHAVVDFIDLRWWPVFNVADSAVSVAITWLIVSALFHAETPGSG